MPADRVAQLYQLTPTYSGRSVDEASAPEGFRAFSRERVLRRRDFDGVARDLFGWEVQRRAGLDVRAESMPLTVGSVVEMRLGVSKASLVFACRVVDVIDTPTRCGFTYVTLPGHPETGIEQFLAEKQGERITFSVKAISRPSGPAGKIARVTQPGARLAQSAFTRRYLRALDA